MNNENRDKNQKNSNLNMDENRGYNENSNYEDAKNDYQNIGLEADNNKDDTDISTNADDNISSKNTQNTPGSSGAFPVGAFDISKS